MKYTKKIEVKTDKILGYQYFMDKQHPLSSQIGKVYYHRHVASLKIGHWLKENEHVHHVDKNKCNNIPENLLILTAAEHNHIHQPGLEDIECAECKKMFKPDNHRRVHCSRECANIGTRFVDRPSIDILKKEVVALGYSAAGRKYGVSDNAIRKWIK